jgi:LysM repeat protein
MRPARVGPVAGVAGIMAAMTDRPSAPTERARACPFVAFEDDRDERSDRPDHRHRCYAEPRPAPRAIAHQEAYCLSTSFPACPTFQDWARREAAHAAGASSGGPSAPPRGALVAGAGAVAGAGVLGVAGVGAVAGAGAVTGPVAGAGAVAGAGDLAGDNDEDDGDDRDPEQARALGDDPPRNASRDWAAPPPWLGATPSDDPTLDPGRGADTQARPGGGLASSRWLADVEPGDEIDREGDDVAATTPAFLAGRGGSRAGEAAGAAAGLAGAGLAGAGLAGAGLAGAGGSAGSGPTPGAAPDGDLADLVTRTRPAGSPVRRDPRPMAGQQRPGRRPPPPSGDEGPSWERPHRFEAYPTLKTRVGLPSIPRIGVAVAALVIAAILLFMIPALFFGKNDSGPLPSLPSSVAPSVSSVPTAVAAATPVTYTIVAGDNLSKIAKEFGVTQAQILTANPKIKDANKITVGQVIVIPIAVPTVIIDSTSPSPGASGASSTP